MKTVSLRSLQRNIGFFERSCESNMIRIRLENGRSAGNSGRGSSPLSQIRRSNARHDKTRENPLYLSEQSRDIPFRRVDPSRAPSAPEYCPDSDQRERERERERASARACVCVCVCQTLLLRVIAPSAGHLHLHLHLIIFQTLLSKATYNWGIHKAIKLEEANIQRKCS